MANRQLKKARELERLCAKLDRDGGEAFFLNQQETDVAATPKSLQLFRQVEQCLSICFASFEEEELQKLSVCSVQPAGGNSALLVILTHEDGVNADLEMCEELLEEARGDLRDEVASAITRRKCPELNYRIVNN